MTFVPGAGRLTALSIGLFFTAGAGAQAPVSAAAPVQAPAAAQEERLPFAENLGKFASGEALPNLMVQTPDGKPARLYDYISGKAAIIAVWDGRGPGDKTLQWLDRLAADYRAQGAVVLGLTCWSAREGFDQWMAANRGKYSFPVVFDPAGAAPATGKPYDELTSEEKTRFQSRMGEYMKANIIGQLMRIPGTTSLPALLAVDRDGKLVGWTSGMGDTAVQGLGNLLLRAGLQLNDNDWPRKVWSRNKTQAPEPVKILAAGADAPDFTALDAGGKPVKLSDYRGKVVVLDFWATWCAPCLAAMPETAEVATKYQDQGVVVLGSCTADTRAAFEKWVAANQKKYPDVNFVHDPRARDSGSVSSKLYGVSGIPAQFIIGRDGRITQVLGGYARGEAVLERALASAGVKVDPALKLSATKVKS